VGFCSLLVGDVSPKSQDQPVISPVDESVNKTSKGVFPEVGVPEKLETGSPFEFHPASLAIILQNVFAFKLQLKDLERNPSQDPRMDTGQCRPEHLTFQQKRAFCIAKGPFNSVFSACSFDYVHFFCFITVFSILIA